MARISDVWGSAAAGWDTGISDPKPATSMQSDLVSRGLVSAVLVLLYEHRGQPYVVLTRRGRHLRRHACEVAFPGGHREDSDSDLWATALREAREEIALDPTSVKPLGRLGNFVTVKSRELVCPFVGLAEQRPDLVASATEVEAVLHVPIRELLSEAVWREEIWVLEPGSPERTMTFFELADDTVWGVTAAILRQLLAVVTGVVTSP